MPKFPRPIKPVPSKAPPPPKPAIPLQRRIPRITPVPPPSQPLPPKAVPIPAGSLQKVWDTRPKLSDLKRLSDEDLKSAQHQEKVRKWRLRPLPILAVVAFGMGMYGVMLYTSLSREVDPTDVPADLSDRFDKEAEGYDEKVGLSERMLFLTSKRKKLTAKAKGHVLEVAVGTGRNIPYYKTKQCATVTLLDTSGPMLAVAKRKWNDTHKEYFSRTFFKQQSALDPIIPPYGAQDGYDTVIQTMGLCSTPEPVKLLQNLEASTNEDGQILLLEHGQSHYDWLNDILDKSAPAHANEHGCWWNKDIGKIVEESGLEVVDIKRYNFGTTWWVELKPRKGLRKSPAETIAGVQPPLPHAEHPVVQKPWWWFWD